MKLTPFLVHDGVQLHLLIHLNGRLFVAAVGPGRVIGQALHAVWLMYGHVHEALKWWGMWSKSNSTYLLDGLFIDVRRFSRRLPKSSDLLLFFTFDKGNASLAWRFCSSAFWYDLWYKSWWRRLSYFRMLIACSSISFTISVRPGVHTMEEIEQDERDLVYYRKK